VGPARRTFRPRLEALEDRHVPTVWTVTSPVDNVNQPNTLRWAVAQAANGDTIDIRIIRTIVLTQGELYLAHDLTINGVPGPLETVEDISGDHLSRVFEVAPTAHVHLAVLGLFWGNGVANNPSGTIAENDGGAILNQGTLDLTDCQLFDNRDNPNLSLRTSDHGAGGAIYNNGISDRFGTPAVGALTLTNCQLFHNFSGSVGGAIFNEGGNVSVVHCYLHRNTAHLGGAIHNEGGTTVVTNSELDNNSAGTAGGAIENASSPYLTSTSTLTVSGCYFVNNSSGNVSGGGNGGAIANDNFGGAPSLGVYNCGFLSNHSGYGAGIFNDGSMEVGGSLFDQNVATYGGGAISNYSTATVLSCQLIDNAALFGGGILNGGVLYLGWSLLQTNTPDNLDNLGTYHDLGFNTFK
jgi:predicted outer membrane repeat protein